MMDKWSLQASGIPSPSTGLINQLLCPSQNRVGDREGPFELFLCCGFKGSWVSTFNSVVCQFCGSPNLLGQKDPFIFGKRKAFRDVVDKPNRDTSCQKPCF